MGASDPNPDPGLRRTEPIFGLHTPILFAHRGGAREVPESTRRAFRHALERARAEVLELDIQLTADGEIVVWHGPELDNVKIAGLSDDPALRPRNRIYDFAWAELDGRAWVADPVDQGRPDLAAVPPEADRALMRLSDFLAAFPGVPLNIEIKDSFLRRVNDTDRKGLTHHLRVLTDILAREGGGRPIVVVSAVGKILDAFRAMNGDAFPTGLSFREQLLLQALGPRFDMRRRALETSYSELASSRLIIDAVRRSGGATFVFLTEFSALLPAIDAAPGTPSRNQLFAILDRGVDGIMTDRPRRVRKLMDEWIAAH